MGPYLKWGEAPVTAGDGLIPLPFRALGGLHPALARLTWPERWAGVMSLGLIAAAARAPRPGLFAALILAEAALRPGNLPLQRTPLAHEAPWRDLAAVEGAVLELPLARPWRAAGLPGRHGRYHRRPVVNPLLMPPGREPPAGWRAWVDSQPICAAALAVGRGEAAEVSAADADALRAAGVGAIALGLGPELALSAGRRRLYVRLLEPALGAPEDRGAYLIWWLDPPPELAPFEDPDGWRTAHAPGVPPALETLIEPLWAKPLSRRPPRR